MTTRIPLVLLAVLLLPGVSAAQDKAKKESPKDRFYQARRVMLDGDAKTAAELFKTLEASERGTTIAGDCLYWMGRCYLRFPDKEPDAVVALLRLVKEHPSSPFLDDAARELAALGDKAAIPILEKRVEAGGADALLAGKALVEFKVKAPETVAGKVARSQANEIAELKAEIARLKKEVEEALALVKKLLAEKEKDPAKKKPAEGGEKGGKK